MKKRLILLKNVKYNFLTAVDAKDNGMPMFYDDGEHIVISEVVEVDFPELSREEVVNSEITVIEERMTKVKADCEASLTALEGRKQELLAIGHES